MEIDINAVVETLTAQIAQLSLDKAISNARADTALSQLEIATKEIEQLRQGTTKPATRKSE